MKVAGLFPVGVSDGGCPAAITEILKREASLDVYLLYGKQAASDAADPKETVERIKATADEPRVSWAGRQCIEPFDLSEAYRQIRAFVAEISRHGYNRVYVGITGATNPIVTSLFQIAMAYLACQVIPIYVKARGKTSVQHFLASDVRDRITAEEALATARGGQVRVAARLAERLPATIPWRFLRDSLAALALWDDFDYKQANGALRHLARNGHEYAQDPLIGVVSRTIVRFALLAGQMTAFIGEICDLQRFAAKVAGEGWTDRVSLAGPLLVADALANANRRIVEGRFTDSVLRSYRAAECATQMRLFAIGIHPSKPDACKKAYDSFSPGVPAIEGLAFRAGLEFLASSGQLDLGAIQDDVLKLASARNYTYLEHGYERVQRDKAQRCFERSLSICQHVLGVHLSEIWEQFEMQF